MPSAPTRSCVICTGTFPEMALTRETNTAGRHYYYCGTCHAASFPPCGVCGRETTGTTVGRASASPETIAAGGDSMVRICGPCITAAGTTTCRLCGNYVLAVSHLTEIGGIKCCPRCTAQAIRCARCGMPTPVDHLSYANRYLSAAQQTKAAVCRKCLRLPLDITTTNRNRSRRLVGVEIEYLTPRGMELMAPKHGIVKGDGSVGGMSGYQGREFNSFPAAGDALLQLIADVTKSMGEQGCQVNKTCGLHVHLDMREEAEGNRRNLICWWHVMEPLILGLVANTRWNNGYAKPCTNTRTDDRYRSLNITAYDKFGTFEVRLHHGTIDGRELTNWVLFLLSFFDTFTRVNMSRKVEVEVMSMSTREKLSFLMHQTQLPMSMRKHLVETINRHKNPEAIKALTKSRKAGSKEEEKAAQAAAAAQGEGTPQEAAGSNGVGGGAGVLTRDMISSFVECYNYSRPGRFIPMGPWPMISQPQNTGGENDV